MDINLEEVIRGRCGVGGAIFAGAGHWGAERAHGLCAPFLSSVVLPTKSENINGNWERVFEGK